MDRADLCSWVILCMAFELGVVVLYLGLRLVQYEGICREEIYCLSVHTASNTNFHQLYKK